MVKHVNKDAITIKEFNKEIEDKNITEEEKKNK